MYYKILFVTRRDRKSYYEVDKSCKLVMFIMELLIPFSQHFIISTGRDTELIFSKEVAK